jgi:hypothetical protein
MEEEAARIQSRHHGHHRTAKQPTLDLPSPVEAAVKARETAAAGRKRRGISLAGTQNPCTPMTARVVLCRSFPLNQSHDWSTTRRSYVVHKRRHQRPKVSSIGAKWRITYWDYTSGEARRRTKVWGEGWVFPSKRAKCGHLTTVARQFQNARKDAGLPDDLVLYCARHGFGTEMYRATKNLFAVMKAMGHAAVATTMKYQHQDIDEIAHVASQRLQ